MPYIKNLASTINGADACGAGMKKAGIISTTGWSRIPSKILRSKTPQKVPEFKLTCCRSGGQSRWTWGNRVPRNGTN
jgi:hypothetical protein